MVQPLDTLTETPSQTAGPYVHIGCTPNFAGIGGVFADDPGRDPFPPDAPGTRITLRGFVFDGGGERLRDVMIESWQVGAEGQFGPGAQGFGRMPADQVTGEWTLNTIRPAAAGAQAPHIALWVVARGINIGLQTRIYFKGDDHDTDPVMQRARQIGRAETLLAAPGDDGIWRFDIRLQGPGETVFLDM